MSASATQGGHKNQHSKRRLTLAGSDSRQISQDTSNSPSTCRLAYGHINVYILVQAILP